MQACTHRYMYYWKCHIRIVPRCIKKFTLVKKKKISVSIQQLLSSLSPLSFSVPQSIVNICIQQKIAAGCLPHAFHVCILQSY